MKEIAERELANTREVRPVYAMAPWLDIGTAGKAVGSPPH